MNYSIIILFLFILSCKKDNKPDVPCTAPTNERQSSLKLLEGHWIFAFERYGDQFSGQEIIKTPATLGYTKERSFNKNYTEEFFINSGSQGLSYYDIVVESSISGYPDDSGNVLVFKSFSTGNLINYVHYKICNDTLTLNYQLTSSFAGQEKWYKN
jgi:hypothetical protein